MQYCNHSRNHPRSLFFYLRGLIPPEKPEFVFTYTLHLNRLPTLPCRNTYYLTAIRTAWKQLVSSNSSVAMAHQDRTLAPTATQQEDRPGRNRVEECSHHNLLNVILEEPPSYEVMTAYSWDGLPPYDADISPPEFYLTEFSWSRYYPITQPPNESARAASREAIRAHLENRVLAADSNTNTAVNGQNGAAQNGHPTLGTRGAAYLNIFEDNIERAGLSVRPDVSTWPRRQHRRSRSLCRYLMSRVITRPHARHHAGLEETPLGGTETEWPQTIERRNVREPARERL